MKKAEHLWKGMSADKTQISPIRPEPYGDRFIKFISGITMPREDAEKQSDETAQTPNHLTHSSTDRVMEMAEKAARRSDRDGSIEAETPERILSAARSPSAERSNGIIGATLPVVEEVGEGGSTGGRSGRSQERDSTVRRQPSDSLLDGSPPLGGKPPPTPPKDHSYRSRASLDKQLPSLPPAVLPHPIPITDSLALLFSDSR